MFGLFKKREADSRPRYEVKLQRGARGHWRVFVYDDAGELTLLSPVQGYPSRMAARAAAGKFMSARFEMSAEGEGAIVLGRAASAQPKRPGGDPPPPAPPGTEGE